MGGPGHPRMAWVRDWPRTNRQSMTSHRRPGRVRYVARASHTRPNILLSRLSLRALSKATTARTNHQTAVAKSDATARFAIPRLLHLSGLTTSTGHCQCLCPKQLCGCGCGLVLRKQQFRVGGGRSRTRPLLCASRTRYQYRLSLLVLGQRELQTTVAI